MPYSSVLILFHVNCQTKIRFHLKLIDVLLFDTPGPKTDKIYILNSKTTQKVEHRESDRVDNRWMNRIFDVLQSDDPEHQRRMEEIERRLLEQKLQWQQKQSEADAKWLQAEEQNMVNTVKPGLHVNVPLY